MSVESMNATNVAANVQATTSTQVQGGSADKVSQKALQNENSQAQPSQEMTADEVQAVVDKLNEFMSNGQRNLNFSVDNDTENVVVKVMDTETQEVIRQFPSEQTLKLAKHLEGMLGLILNDRA